MSATQLTPAHHHNLNDCKDELLLDFSDRYKSWESYTVGTTAKDILVPVKNVHSCKVTDSVKTVLSMLFSYKLLSMPVYDLEKEKFRAFIDVYDILLYVLHLQEKLEAKEKQENEATQQQLQGQTQQSAKTTVSEGCDKLDKEELSTAELQKRNFENAQKTSSLQQQRSQDLFDSSKFNTSEHEHKRNKLLTNQVAELDIPVHQAMNYSEEDFLFSLPESTPLREILYVMGKGDKHRIWIYNKSRQMDAGLITQSKVLQTIGEDLIRFPEMAGKTLAQLGLAEKRDVIGVSPSDTVLDALRKMREHNIRHLAVVKDGKLVNMFSDTDVKYMSVSIEIFQSLELTMDQYFKYTEEYHCKRSELIVCKKDDSIYDVICLLTQHRVHKAFLVEGKQTPVRILTLTDIIDALFGFCD